MISRGKYLDYKNRLDRTESESNTTSVDEAYTSPATQALRAG